MSNIAIAHYGLRSTDLPKSIEWYGKALGARVLFRNEVAAFMSFDGEHHRLVIWDDGETSARPETANGVDHVGFGCGSLGDLADTFDRLRQGGLEPTLAVNHGFTTSLYYHDPDGNEVEFTADNYPSKAECVTFMASPAMNDAMQPPLFGRAFDPAEFLGLRRAGASEAEMAEIGL